MPTRAKPPARLSIRPHPHLYEINTWAWLEELSARLGRTIGLAEVPDSEWDAIAGNGFDIVWLMGMWQRSAEAKRLALEPAVASLGIPVSCAYTDDLDPVRLSVGAPD